MARIRLSLLLMCVVLAGCAGRNACCCRVATTPRPADVAPPSAPKIVAVDRMDRGFYSGTGRTMDFDAVVAAARDADVVAFGELHGHPVGAEIELALLEAMAAGDRPVALAMEFFERDTQPVLDQYLAGEIDKATLMKKARQSWAYPKTHGPLVDFCKANGMPVIAANAPRSLVSGYRKQDEDYPTYLASLTEEERASLPRTTSTPDDAYRKRFIALMGSERGPSYFRSQALWDDSMAEAITDFRDANPDHRVLFVVGGFHVTGRLGSMTKIWHRRKGDKGYVLVMSQMPGAVKVGDDGKAMGPPMAWDPDDKGAGDAVLRVRQQPKPKKVAKSPHPKT